jgi:hypothetical protein
LMQALALVGGTRMDLGYGFTSSRLRDQTNHPRIRRRAKTVSVCGKKDRIGNDKASRCICC